LPERSSRSPPPSSGCSGESRAGLCPPTFRVGFALAFVAALALELQAPWLKRVFDYQNLTSSRGPLFPLVVSPSIARSAEKGDLLTTHEIISLSHSWERADAKRWGAGKLDAAASSNSRIRRPADAPRAIEF
jgi:hypothetical protein